MSSGYSELGNSFDIGADAAFQFAGARNFVISDVEVLSKEDNLCGSKCNHPEGRCDQITGKCICDWEERNVEWCLEGEPKKIFNLYQDAASYWALDSVEDLKDRARLGWGTAYGGVSLAPKGLSGHALQLDGVSGWVDLGDLDAACAEASCSEDFSISMWIKYYPKETKEDQSFLKFNNGMTEVEVFYDARLKQVGLALHTSALSTSYSFYVAKGFWTYLGFSWKSEEKLHTIQQNGDTLPTTITWNVCHACNRSQTSNTSVTLGASSFPNASFDEIAIWLQPLQKENFVNIFDTYKGPERLNVQLSLQFTNISWSNNFSDPESEVYTTFLQSLTDEITTFYLNKGDVTISSENISLSNCWDNDGLVCNLTLHYYSTGYKQLGLLLDDWLPHVNISKVVLLWRRNDNVPSTPVPGLTASASGASSVEVSWGTPSENDVPGILTGYAIYYKAVSSKHDWVRKTTANTDEPYTIVKLEANTNYTVNVTTVSLEGEGIAASVNVMTQEGAPPRPPANVTASNTSSTSIELAWDPPEGRIPGLIRGYRVFYTKEADIINQTTYTTVDNESITNHIAGEMALMNVTVDNIKLFKYVITWLEPYTKYCVWMTVFTVADSPNSHAVFLYTDEDVPDEAPAVYEVSPSSSEECQVRWYEFPQEHHRGMLLGFRIVYTVVNDPSDSSNITVDAVYKSGIVNGLRPYTDYLLKVAGFTSKGDGNYSIPVTCQTLESVPSRPPVDIQVYNITSTSCEVRWGLVPVEHRNGNITGYQVKYGPRYPKANLSKTSQKIDIEADTYSYRLTGLDIYTKYVISIVGKTSVGPGVHDEDSKVKFKTEAYYPSAIPTGLSVVASTPDTCEITWFLISGQDINGDLVSYEVHAVKKDSADPGLDAGLTMFVCDSTTNIKVSKLDVFTKYNIKVAVHNHILSGNYSEAIECTTGEGAPSLPPQNIRGYNTSGTSIKILWDPVPEAYRNGIIREYHFRIWPLQQPVANFNDVDKTGDLYKTFTGLHPFWNYSIEMAAKTVARGNFSEPIFVTTGEGAPETAPQIVQVYNTSGRSIFVQWTPPPGPIPGILRGYRIRYQNMNVSGPVQEYSVDASTLSYEISWLEAYTQYSIMVLAFTVADGPESDKKMVYTDKKILPPPDGIPENLTLGGKTSTSCELLWEAARNSIADPDGATLGYFIYYRTAGSNDTFTKSDVQGANITSSDVQKLEEFTSYEFNVVAYNYYGEGNASDVFHCETEEDAPSSTPFNVTSVHVTPQGIQFKWDLPPEIDWNGYIRGIKIMYYRKVEGNSSATFVDVPINSLNVQGNTGNTGVRRKRATDLNWSLTGLEEYTLYIIRVLFYTVGDSQYSPPVEIQTAEDAPSSPPSGILANNASSTSIWVTWSDVPDIDQNGVIRGFLIGYREKDDPVGTVIYANVSESSAVQLHVPSGRRRKRAAGTSYKYVLNGLKVWTEYLVRVAAYTVSLGPFSEPSLVRTDEGVPCLPPQYVTYDVPGMTVLLAKWNPVPEHCRNGVILGYRVKYRRLDGASQARIENTTAQVLYAFLYDMDIYANYSIEISAFTRKGEGNATLDLALPDTLGPKSTPMNVTGYNYTSTTSINVTWKPIEDDFILERMLGYRVSYRAVRIGDEEVEEGEEPPTYNFTVRKTTLDAVIEGLDTYTRYQINVSGFTRKGDGPSAITAGDTCRCQKRLATNYRLFPPYVDQLEVTDGGHLTVANMTGMLPLILDKLVVTCCQTCLAHGGSYVDFMYNGTNGTAEQNSEQEMKFLIEDRNDLSFPVYGWKWQEYYSAYYRYIPLVESPGVAFIIIENEALSPSERLVNEIFATWPYCVVTTLLAALAGIIMWFLDTKSNPDQFPHSFCRGSGNGFWWAFISMTTIGYGDKVPSAHVSKVFAIFWILTGLVLMGILSGALTSAITVFVFKTDIILYGTKVAAIQDTPEYRLAVSRNARVNEAKSYTTFSEVYDALINQEVQGMLIDTYEAGTKKDQFKDPRIRIHTIFDYKSTYGVVLAGNSTKLLQCSKSYMQANKDEMFEHISKFIHSIMEEHIPESVEVASGLFDPYNDVFRYFSCIIGFMLVAAIVMGLIWEYRKKVRARKAAQREGHRDVLESKELLQEMKTFVGEFYCTFKENYSRLTQKHRSELRSLKIQRPVSESGSSNFSNARLWPKNKVFY